MKCFSCFDHKQEVKRVVNRERVEQRVNNGVVDANIPRASSGLDKLKSRNSPGQRQELMGTKVGPDSHIASQTFTFRELAAATKNFKADCFLGEGGFGRVYKGWLESTGQVVAIKQLNRNGLQGNREFLVEVLMLSLLHHSNLVNLIGYCADGDQRLLVYEFMPLGSLEDHLHDLPPDKEPLDWNIRMKIAAGAAKGLITACDIRYCTESAFFSVKEVDVGITADLGTLQRLPRIVGYGNAVELALTGRRFTGIEAKAMGLVSGVFRDKKSLDDGVRLIAEGIAAKSPLAVTGTKAVLLRSRDVTLEQGLDYVATWNAAMLLSSDLTEAIAAQTQKKKPVFSKL